MLAAVNQDDASQIKHEKIAEMCSADFEIQSFQGSKKEERLHQNKFLADETDGRLQIKTKTKTFKKLKILLILKILKCLSIS